MEQAVRPGVRVTLHMGEQPSTRAVGGREVLQGRLVLPSGAWAGQLSRWAAGQGC